MADIFFSGLEYGDLSEFDLIQGTVSVQSTVVRTGNYAIQLNSSANRSVRVNVASNSIYFHRVYIRISALPAAVCSLLTPGGNIAANSLVVELQTDGKLKLDKYVAGVKTNIGISTTTLSINVWHLIETKWVINSTTGIGELKINENIEITSGNTDTGTGTANLTRFGTDVTAGGNIEIYYDDIRMSNSAYPGAGQCIARSPNAGAPTYDQWSKSVGVDAFALWDDTPFNATDFCNTTNVTTDPWRQSSQAGNFDATQTGHGTEIIGSGDTINACKVAIIAKRSTGAGRTFKILRRLNGIDTETIKDPGTVDTYLDDGIWADTLTNLNTMEIGGKREGITTGQQFTIEDMWVSVDYTPSAVVFPSELFRKPYNNTLLRM